MFQLSGFYCVAILVKLDKNTGDCIQAPTINPLGSHMLAAPGSMFRVVL